MFICVVHALMMLYCINSDYFFTCSEKFPKDISSSVLQRLDCWRHEEDIQWLSEFTKCTQKLSFLWPKTYCLTEEEVFWVNCSWTHKKMVEGNTKKSSPEVQREDGWVSEICLWINSLQGKNCLHATSWTCTFDTLQHTIQTPLAAQRSGGKVDSVMVHLTS